MRAGADSDANATEQEMEWARAIKKAAELDQEVNTAIMSDLEYVQLALVVANGDISRALKRIKRLQKFKQEYGIKLDGSHDEGMRDLQMLQAAHPGFVLSIGVLAASNDHQPHVMCADYAQFLSRKMKSDESFAILMRGFFYCMQASQPNVNAMRSGVYVLADGHGVGWRNFSMAMEERAAALYSDSYPMKINQIVILNSNLLMRLFWNLMRVFVSKTVWERHVFAGNGRDYIRHTERYQHQPQVLPKRWGGNFDETNLLDTLSEKLLERYELAARFKL